MTDLKATLDRVLDGVVSGDPRVPGVVAMVTDRSRDIYSGAAGDRVLGAPVYSAGMSQDLEIAIAEGSTLVRVGTDIMGPRPVI